MICEAVIIIGERIIHRKLLDEIAPEQFDVSHYAALAVLKKK